MRKQTKVIDAQVHAYERNHPERPWAGTLQGPDEVTGDDMVEAMDAVRVDGALLVSPYSMYRFDPSYALEVSRQYPGRFGLIRPFDPNSTDLDEQMVEWARHPGVVGARIMLNPNPTESSRPVWTSEHPGLNSILRSASKHNLPVNLLGWGGLDLVGDLAKRNPNTQVVLDHLGLPQPFVPPPPASPFSQLEEVLALAEIKNLAIKITGACTLSHEPFPYGDIWPYLERIFRAFGLGRCMWGTDWTRAIELLDYQQGVEAFRQYPDLSDSERDQLMGGTVEEIYGWTPTNLGK